MNQPKIARCDKKDFTQSCKTLGIVLVVFLCGCTSLACRNRVTNLTLKSPLTGERQITGTPSYTFAVPGEGRASNNSLYDIYTANYNLDPSHFALSMRKPLTSDEQIRLEILLGGGSGTTDKSLPKVGVYSVHGDDGTWVNVIIYSRKNGIENRTVLNINTPLIGQVRVTSVSADWLAAEVDLIAAETSIKGTFEAKILGADK